ncbi:type VI secretion protein VasK [Rubrivivax gelatinosus]|uniref:type VI secretion system membrane subunit TssM n=1 Tax=Rubrivivax gelatinosus TaxID=28068 RepID=UPI001908388A|nr:type VI secretion system membrane subunit TssM [Rubrivivax gelatinosus]MBK1613891.1 type VI secretion protein VasK [Rubrivivax gelatinosus]
MNRIWTFLLNPRVLGVIGLAALAAFLFLGASALQVALVWAGIALGALIAVGLAVWGIRKLRARRAARALEQAIEVPGAAEKQAPRADVSALRTRLVDAVKTIQKSKLGQLSGSAALYELPWYMVIGNPAAGKSTAIVKSGLKFPFADGGDAVIQGIGGTRNCDWFFTSEGILLDTAGRYAVHEEDRQEWLGFLGLLKRHRPKAPINGILIAASLAELGSGRPEAAIQLAKNLRQRVQELTETLEVIAPVYLVFTKADLIAGFAEFFEDRDRSERERVWGATLPYAQAQRGDAVAAFDRHFDELYEGLKQMTLARMAMERGKALPPGVLTFPLEFAERKTALRAFVATLFEENPYQYQPVFRGFYFTSSVQEGSSASKASERVAQQFALEPRADRVSGFVVAENGFFLKDLFSKVIFADKGLVQQHASRGKQRLRLATFSAALLLLALATGSWTWSYVGNRQLMANVRADLDYAVRLQAENPDLGSRMQALETLQDRIEQLQRYRQDRPLGISLGLYQGEEIEAKLRQEYFAGIRQVMLEPAAAAIEAYLAEVSANPGRLKPLGKPPESGAATAAAPRTAGRYVDASVEDAGDAYNALKTYLMLADRERIEPVHLAEQITRFWRGWLDSNRGSMPRERLMQSAERMISFSAGLSRDPAFPTVANKLALVDQMRELLREQRRGVKGVERVYADIKTRASTRFPPMTVARLIADGDKDVIAGSHAIPGTFTREAWDGYIAKAFKEAATQELQSSDWVLNIAARDDLTLEGSPEQIQKQLTELYKTEYVREWQRFMQGISIAEFGSFDEAVKRMNRLGDPANSPIRVVLTTLFDQTSWDNPSLLNERLGKAQKGFVDWIRQTILRQAPQRVEVKVDVTGASAGVPMGPIGREFAALSRIMTSRDSTPPPIKAYLENLSKVRTRFNQIKNQGDPGPGSRVLLAATLEGPGSELAEALRLVDEQLLLGMTDTAKATLRPLLVRPLIQALAVVVPPAETEVNRVWAAQVSEPFQRTLASKYPFDTRSTVEAAPQDIAKIFGPDGAIAKFSNEALGPLVVRRGDAIEPRQWAEVGVRLRPEFTGGFGSWVAQLDAASGGGGVTTASSGGAVAAAADQTLFQILPQGAPGFVEYTVVIDGQSLRYRNAAAQWTDMVWPNRAGVAGARLSGVTHDGKTVEFVNEPGNSGLGRFMELAQKKRLDGGVNELKWTQGRYSVTVHLRVLRQPGEPPPPSSRAATAPGTAPIGTSRLQGLRLPTLVAGVDATAAAASSPKASP